MLSKCANPGCPAPFRYFHQGKLFRVELQAEGTEGLDFDTSRARRRLEFYWLCADCAVTMTLAFQKGTGIIVAPVKPTPPAKAVVETPVPPRSEAEPSFRGRRYGTHP